MASELWSTRTDFLLAHRFFTLLIPKYKHKFALRDFFRNSKVKTCSFASAHSSLNAKKTEYEAQNP